MSTINANDARFLALLGQDGTARFRDFQSLGLNDKTTKEVLDRLLQNDYIEKDETSESRPVYKITKLGSKALKEEGVELLAVEAAKREAEAEAREGFEDDKEDATKNIFKVSMRLRILAMEEFERHLIGKIALTAGGYGFMTIKRQISGPVKGVEVKYANWLMGLTIRAVDYENESVRLSYPPAIRAMAAALWLEARGFIHEPLFDYRKSVANPTNQHLYKMFISELQKDKGKSEIWLKLRKGLDAECSDLLGRKVSLEEAQFATILGWLRLKLMVLREPKFNKQRKKILTLALRNCNLS